MVGIRNLPPSLRRYAVRGAYRTLRPEASGLDSGLVEAVLGLLVGGEGTRTLDLPESIVVASRTTGELAFYEAQEMDESQVELEVGTLEFGERRVEVRRVEVFDRRDAVRDAVAYLDAGRGPYLVRMAREGDHIRPLGLGGTKKVMRTMMDRRVPADVRRRTPVVVDPRGEIAWVFCGELGEEYKVRASTEKILRLEVSEVHGNV
jgi:tRNA(Ile)-lysidine synthase